jgi:transcriptional regulator with XRE-family HTH domain
MDKTNPWVSQSEVLGEFIRSQRRLANLSLRQLATRTAISNPYLSQIERGLHEPSLRVLKAIAEALDLSAEAFLAQAGLLAEEPPADNPSQNPSTVAAIRTDPTLNETQKAALLAVYQSYQEANVTGERTLKVSKEQPSPGSRKDHPGRTRAEPSSQPRHR